GKAGGAPAGPAPRDWASTGAQPIVQGDAATEAAAKSGAASKGSRPAGGAREPASKVGGAGSDRPKQGKGGSGGAAAAQARAQRDRPPQDFQEAARQRELNKTHGNAVCPPGNQCDAQQMSAKPEDQGSVSQGAASKGAGKGGKETDTANNKEKRQDAAFRKRQNDLRSARKAKQLADSKKEIDQQKAPKPAAGVGGHEAAHVAQQGGAGAGSGGAAGAAGAAPVGPGAAGGAVGNAAGAVAGAVGGAAGGAAGGAGAAGGDPALARQTPKTDFSSVLGQAAGKVADVAIPAVQKVAPAPRPFTPLTPLDTPVAKVPLERPMTRLPVTPVRPIEVPVPTAAPVKVPLPVLVQPVKIDQPVKVEQPAILQPPRALTTPIRR
ncbi:MAG: hypothetical protein ACREUH_10330, partial [Burkholderiales bacterium]